MCLMRYSVPATSIAYQQRSPRCSEQCPPPPFTIAWDCCAEHVDLQQIVFDPSVLATAGLPPECSPRIVCLLAPIHLPPLKRVQSSEWIRFLLTLNPRHTLTHTPQRVPCLPAALCTAPLGPKPLRRSMPNAERAQVRRPFRGAACAYTECPPSRPATPRSAYWQRRALRAAEPCDEWRPRRRAVTVLRSALPNADA